MRAPRLLLWALVAVLALLGEQVLLGGPVVRLDRRVETWLVPRRDNGLTDVARHLTDLGLPSVAVPLLVLLVVGLAVHRHSPGELLRPLVAVVALTVGVLVLKDLVGRPSPHGSTSSGGAWPSGHTTTATVVWGCAVQALRLPRRAARVVSAGVPFVVGVCLVLAGYHLVSDVLAGWALGALLLVLTARLPVPGAWSRMSA